ncbi:RagB/SusD family nutrient uptake outer membrane protein [Flagellimonas sp.]|uniref:RagB/SusD family nutrient uptake outer membrane protein n=1 Tax=Flagellimonas sp. TaxID=2058762 RepID=UPI003BAEC068
MKKYIFNIRYNPLTVIVIAILLTSCSKDFLDVVKDDTVNADTFYRTEADVQLAVAGVYELLTSANDYQRYQVIGRNLWSDDIWRGGFVGPNFDFEPVAIGSHSPTTKPIVDMWNYCYTMIRRANDFLLSTENATIEIDENLLTRYRNEVRFLRAYAFQELVFLYGDVPFFTETPTSVEIKTIGRSPKSIVLDFIISELDVLSDELPSQYSGSDIGRITKGAAESLLSRVLLSEGDYTGAAAASQEVISSGNYGLENLGEIFLLANEGNQEVIWDAHVLETNGSTGWLANYTLPSALGGFGGGTTPSQSLVDAFEMQATGLPISDAASGFDENDPFAGRDPRLAQAIIHPGAIIEGEVFDVSGSTTGYYSKKFYDPAIPRGYGLSQNWILIRYAEVLLNFAEATNEVSGPIATVYEAVNSIRARAGMPDLPAGLSQSEMRERIRNERRVELALEGDRFYSIRRWEIAEDVVPQDLQGIDPVSLENTTVSSGRVFDPSKDYLWPIPQIQIDLTEPGVTTQNPGWD